MEDLKNKYSHSPAHLAVAMRDHDALKRIVSAIPQLAKAGEVNNEAESLAAEKDADIVSGVIDRRDVPGRETPLHLAVRLKDAASAEILMAAGADCSLQNQNGWSALQEAVGNREENIAMIIVRHSHSLSWAKWCRRLPRIAASTARIRDFYMEITFHFESSVIPFIGRIAPSDTYRIWKRGANLRADMTMAGFDGLRTQRSDQTILFLGDGYTSESENGFRSLPPGSLVILGHKKKEVVNALEGAGKQPTETEIANEVSMMSLTNMYRPGIDVTQAELVPLKNWRRQARTEMVGPWKANVYDMKNVMVSVKSRKVPGAMTDKELFSASDSERTANGGEYDDVLISEDRKQLDSALSSDIGEEEKPEYQSSHENFNLTSSESQKSKGIRKEKKGWLGRSKKGAKHKGDSSNDAKSVKKDSKLPPEDKKQSKDDAKSVKKVSKLTPEDNKQSIKGTQKTSSKPPKGDTGTPKKSKDKSRKKKVKGATGEPKTQSEFKKGVRPVLWLTSDFPLKTEELLPLFDILANKVKAIRRLRELLTTTLPSGTFPVKLAIPIVPTVRVVVTFTKFEELPELDDEFSTPPSSPSYLHDVKSKEAKGSKSWVSWMGGSKSSSSYNQQDRNFLDEIDPFYIPSDYVWIDVNEKLDRMIAKRKQQMNQGK